MFRLIRAEKANHPCSNDVPGPGGLGLRLLRLALSSALQAGGRRRRPHPGHPPDPRSLPGDLRSSPGPCRASLRGHPLLRQAGGPAYAQCRHPRRSSTSVASRPHPPTSFGRPAPRPCAPSLHHFPPRSAVGRRHLLRSHRGGMALPGHDPGLLLPAHRGLVDDLPPPHRARGRRLGHGHRSPTSLARPGAPFRPGFAQYVALAFTRRMRQAGIAGSMGSVGDAYDNAAAESLFATIKRELVHRHRFPTRAAARTSVFEFIEVFYNRRRLHSSIGYVSPAEFERRLRHEELGAIVG
jgi:hypothetical protein